VLHRRPTDGLSVQVPAERESDGGVGGPAPGVQGADVAAPGRVANVAGRLWARQHRGTFISAIVVTVLVVYVIQASWAGNPVTLDSLFFFVIVGITLGSIYAVAAAGLVVTYTTSGIFNFAQGAIGMLMAFVYWELKVDLGVQTLVAFLLTVLVAAPLLGALIERGLMRRLHDAPLVAQLAVTIGLMLAFIGLAATIWDPNTSRSIGTFFGTDGFQVANTFIPYYRLITIVSGLAIALGLRFLLFNTRLGVGMRAVVDNRDLAALNGARPGRMSQVSWALGSSMAAIAGIFLAEELSALSVETLTLLIVDAFAAAIIGRLKNLPLTYVGGMVIGLALSFQENFLNWAGRWSTAATAIPTIILFLALLFLPQARIEGRRSYREITPHVPKVRSAALGMLALFAVVVVAGGLLDRPDVRRLALGLVTGFILVSLVPLTGWSGQISLAQITFAGAGAFAFAEWGPHLGLLAGLLVAALFAVPFGVLMALPALRLSGLYLALASMAFARMAEFLFFDQPEVFGSGARRISSVSVLGFNFSEPFTIFGIHFGQDVGNLFLITVLLGIGGVLVVWLRRGPIGRRLVALKDSPAACATFGLNLTATKVIVFAISAAIAGFAGALLGILLGSGSTMDFQMLVGLPYLLLAMVGGIAVVSGAVLGGVLFQGFTWLTEIFPGVTFLVWWMRIGPGLAGIGIGYQPEGAIPKTGDEIRKRRARRATSKQPRAPAAIDAPETRPVPAPGS
jgi:branched-chain amino acid transport system permease protein